MVKHANQQKNPNLPLRLKPYMPPSNSASKRSRAGSSHDERPAKLQKINAGSSKFPVFEYLRFILISPRREAHGS